MFGFNAFGKGCIDVRCKCRSLGKIEVSIAADVGAQPDASETVHDRQVGLNGAEPLPQGGSEIKETIGVR